ncbi:MAG: rhodanese-like domain-containing protein [Alphaproteobacteria bacterium]|nr:rhodanese-like domain-containing protein [Alphaproteobacteria bacterium]MBF0250206.1 rhodanese-like domain-containing protein [Alphaproteobacteria bacterium]
MQTAPLPLEIDAHGLNRIREENLTAAFIDVRTPWEIERMPAVGCDCIPLNQLPQHLGQLPRDVDHLVIVCAHGNRSLMAAHWLRQNGFANAQSLMGGMASWRRYEEMAA